MSVVGMFSSSAGQSDDRIAVDTDQASGLADAAAFAEVLEHGARLFLGEVAVEQRRAFALGEAIFAGVAVEQPDGVVLAIAGADREVSGVALAVEGAIGILATEASEVIPRESPPRGRGQVGSKEFQ